MMSAPPPRYVALLLFSSFIYLVLQKYTHSLFPHSRNLYNILLSGSDGIVLQPARLETDNSSNAQPPSPSTNGIVGRVGSSGRGLSIFWFPGQSYPLSTRNGCHAVAAEVVARRRLVRPRCSKSDKSASDPLPENGEVCDCTRVRKRFKLLIIS